MPDTFDTLEVVCWGNRVCNGLCGILEVRQVVVPLFLCRGNHLFPCLLVNENTVWLQFLVNHFDFLLKKCKFFFYFLDAAFHFLEH